MMGEESHCENKNARWFTLNYEEGFTTEEGFFN